MNVQKITAIREMLLREIENDRKKQRRRRRCDACGCKSSDKKLFEVPSKDPEKEKKWLTNIIFTNVNKKRKFLCAKHFEIEAFTSTLCTTLHRAAVPTIQNPSDLNELPKAYLCMSGLDGARVTQRSNGVGTPSQMVTTNSPVPDVTGDWSNNDSQDTIFNLQTRTTNQSRNSLRNRIIKLQAVADKGTNTSNYVRPDVHTQEYLDLKTKLRAKTQTINYLKRRLAKIDDKKPTGSQIIKYASHYLKGKCLELFASQIRNAVENKKSHRWTQTDIELANLIHRVSPKLYKYIASNNILQLPCTTTLKRFRRSFKPKVNGRVVDENVSEQTHETDQVSTVSGLTVDNVTVLKNPKAIVVNKNDHAYVVTICPLP